MDKIETAIYAVMLILSIMLAILLIIYTNNIYRLHGILQYYHISELSCDKDPMELETIRYNMSKEIDEDSFDNIIRGITITVMVVSFIGIIVGAFILNIETPYGFIYLIIAAGVLLGIYLTNNYKNNKDILNYKIKRNNLITKLKDYFTDNNINTLDDLPQPIFKAILQRYKVIYDIRNRLGEPGYKVVLYSDVELLSALKRELVIDKSDGTTELNVEKLFEYLKLQYDTSRPTYKTDIEYLIQKTLNVGILEVIEPTYYNNTKFVEIVNKQITDTYTIQHQIAELKPYLISKYKDSIQTTGKTSQSVPKKERYYDYLFVILTEHEENNAENNYRDYTQLGYGRYNPYESLNHTFTKTIALLWLLYAIIFYFIFHTIYEKYQEEVGTFITIISLFIFLLLIALMLLRSAI